MPNPLEGKRIVLGVTGSIAAYKAVDLASRLAKQGVIINTILTESAQRFVNPISFQSVTGRKAYTETDLWGGEGHIVHIHLGHNSDLILIAPASANTIAKLANGIADNLLCVTVLAATCPVMLAPAMDAGMFDHPSTQANLRILQERNVNLIEPAYGHLASGLTGKGRMEDAVQITRYLRYFFSQKNSLQGKKLVITAGGTQEPIDPVRMISNRSSGKQGYALAQAGLDVGAQVILISTPTQLEPPFGCKVIRVEQAEHMRAAVMDEIGTAHALIMSAAVADFTPVAVQKEKIKKEKTFKAIELKSTRDILREVNAFKKENKLDLKIIGFAAESQNLKVNAHKKLQEKGLDMIIANDISQPQSGFGADTNQVLLLFADGSHEQLPLMSKQEVAEKIIQHLVSWLTEGAA